MHTSASIRFSLKDLLTSSLGKKYFMGISGLVWSGFLLVHMAGNLLLLVSADLYNSYAHAIVSNKPLLYATESVLLGTFLIHFMLAIRLTVENRKARPSRYHSSPSRAKGSSLAVRTAILSGMTLAIFFVLHLLTFKYGPYYETTVNGVVMRDLHKLVVETFANPLQVGWYVLALLFLGMHLSHGFAAVFQSLGAMDDRTRCWQKFLGYGVAGLVSFGFIIQPICLYFSHSGQ